MNKFKRDISNLKHDQVVSVAISKYPEIGLCQLLTGDNSYDFRKRQTPGESEELELNIKAFEYKGKANITRSNFYGFSELIFSNSPDDVKLVEFILRSCPNAAYRITDESKIQTTRISDFNIVDNKYCKVYIRDVWFNSDAEPWDILVELVEYWGWKWEYGLNRKGKITRFNVILPTPTESKIMIDYYSGDPASLEFTSNDSFENNFIQSMLLSRPERDFVFN